MANRCSKSCAKALVNNYVLNIEKQKNAIVKNYNEMDLKNASVKQEIENKVYDIVNNCNILINTIKGYKFY